MQAITNCSIFNFSLYHVIQLIESLGMQSSITQCLPQARINWEGCRRTASGKKWWWWWRQGTGDPNELDCQCGCFYLPHLPRTMPGRPDNGHCSGLWFAALHRGPGRLATSVLPALTWGLSTVWHWGTCCVLLPSIFWYHLIWVVLDKKPLNGCCFLCHSAPFPFCVLFS